MSFNVYSIEEGKEVEWPSLISLYINGHLNDATIINEMVVANWTRRAG